VLELDDGARLTEGAVIDQFIADRAPESKLAPPAGTMARYRLQEWLNFVASEIHKSFGPLFGSASEEAKNQARTRVSARLDLVERQLEKTPYLLGETFTVADGYLYNVLRWTKFTGIDLARWPSLTTFYARIESRPAVQAALTAEKS